MKIFPKVKFKLPSIKNEGKILYDFCFPRSTGWDWSDIIYKNHPDLKKKVLGIKKQNDFLKQCNKYAEKFIKEHKKDLEKAKNDFQKDWNKVGNDYLNILSEHFETEFPKSRKTIKAFVSICPICPRFLDSWSFTLVFDSPEKMRQTVAHEILHFLYFKKWKEVFPKTKKKEMDSPFLVWKLSEILAPIILNNNPKIKKIITERSKNYEEFENIKIGKKKLIPHFENLYKKHLKSKNTFEEFLKTCFQEMEKYKSVLENI